MLFALNQIILLSLFVFSAPLTSEPTVYTNAPMGVYAPQGFDSNDNVEIIFEGQFGSACYKTGLTFHTVDEENKKIYITDTAHYFGQAFCASVMVPYQKGIQAGLLSPGEYRIYFRHSRGNFVEEAFIPVTATTHDNADDYLYAPVKGAQFYHNDDYTAGHLRLHGSFTNTCMKIDEVKVIPHLDNNVVDILPVATLESDGCKEVPEGIPYYRDVEIKGLQAGRFLFHVRSLNGQSVNEIVSFR